MTDRRPSQSLHRLLSVFAGLAAELQQHCREFTGCLFRKYPAGLALTGILAGILPFLCAPGIPVSSACLPLFLLTVFLWLTARPFDAFVRFLLPGVLAVCFAWNECRTLEQDPLLERFRGHNTRAELRLEVADPTVSPATADWLGVPRRVRCRVIAYRELPETEWHELSKPGYLLLAKIKGPDAVYSPGFGDILECTGKLVRPDAPCVDGMFDYRAFLARKGVSYLCYSPEIRTVSRGTGFRRCIFDFRDVLTDRLCSSIPQKAERMLAPGLLFGLRQGVENDTKDDFMKSGMIHLLSVSGTHVMIFALVVLLLLSWLPLRPRYFIAIILCFLYAISTGLGVPAFRAFLMFAMLFGMRAFLHRSIGLNTLFLCACVVLLMNPSDLLDSGFQFSFLTVAALIGGTGFIRFWVLPPSLDQLYVPGKYRAGWTLQKMQFRRKFKAAIAGCAIAFLASLALSLRYQGICPAGSVAANLIASPVITLIFAFFAGCSLFAWIPGVDVLCGWGLNVLLQIVTAAGMIFADWGFYTLQPSWWSIALFTFAGIVLLCARDFRILAASLSVMAAILLFWFYQPEFKKPESAVISGGGMEGALIHADPASGQTVVLFSGGNYKAGLQTSLYLGTLGIRTCEFCFLLDATSASLKALESLQKNCPAATIVVPKRALKKLPPSDSRIQIWQTNEKTSFFESDDLKCTVSHDMLELEINRSGESYHYFWDRTDTGSGRISVRRPEKNGGSIRMPLQSGYTVRKLVTSGNELEVMQK